MATIYKIIFMPMVVHEVLDLWKTEYLTTKKEMEPKKSNDGTNDSQGHLLN